MTGQYGTTPPPSYGEHGPRGAAATSITAAPGPGTLMRPGGVLAAVVLSLLGGLFVLVLGVFAALGGAMVTSQVGWGTPQSNVVAVIAGSTLAVGSLIIVLAIVAFRRANWARWVLIGTAGLTALGSLYLTFREPAFLLSTVYLGAIAALLLTQSVRRWYRPHRTHH